MTVCLTAIVKNEAHVIGRMIESVKPLIDTFVIVDTGSTDNTIDEAKKAFQGMEGTIERIEWKSFGHARTKAFELAKGKADYALVLDADELTHGELPKDLTNDAYALWLKFESGGNGLQHRLFNLKHDWRYEGIVHELPNCDANWTWESLESAWLTTPQDGARSQDPKKHVKMAELITLALASNPTDARLVFHLAMSWRDAGHDQKALQYFELRSGMGQGANGEEPYISLLEGGRALERLGHSGEAIMWWLRAHALWPERCEASRELARTFSQRALNAKNVGTLYNEFHCSTELEQWTHR